MSLALRPIGGRDIGRRVAMELGQAGFMAVVAPAEIDAAARIATRLGQSAARLEASDDVHALSARLRETTADPTIVSGLDRLSDGAWQQLDRLRGRITRDRLTLLVSGDGSAYWPPEAPRTVTVDAFAAAYGMLGYVACDDEDHDVGFEKIAIFADRSGEPTHAARQLDSTHWTSKVGSLQDIRHPLRALEGSTYGQVVLLMKRAVDST